ncbi:MAG TPA: inositol monophosphatase family protein [Pseudonocardia sp.]
MVNPLLDEAGRDDVEEALAFAGALVTRLGESAALRQGSAVEQFKPAAALSGSVVTDVDLDLERAVDDALHHRFPADGVLGEEGADRAPADPRNGRTWVVDPIDGTLNYARRLGPWSVVVSAWRGWQVESVAVWTGGALYTAAAGRGATRDGRPLRLAEQAEPGGIVHAHAALMPAVAQAGWLARTVESSAAEIVAIADGRVMGTVRRGGHRRDLHAPALLVGEAGGVVLPLDDAPLSGASPDLLVAHPHLVEPLLALVPERRP